MPLPFLVAAAAAVASAATAAGSAVAAGAAAAAATAGAAAAAGGAAAVGAATAAGSAIAAGGATAVGAATAAGGAIAAGATTAAGTIASGAATVAGTIASGATAAGGVVSGAAGTIGSVATGAAEVVGSQVARQVGMQAVRTATTKVLTSTAGKVAVGVGAAAVAGGTAYYMYCTYSRALDEAEKDAYATCVEANEREISRLKALLSTIRETANVAQNKNKKIIEILVQKIEALDRDIERYDNTVCSDKKLLAQRTGIDNITQYVTTELPHYEYKQGELVYNDKTKSAGLWEFFDFGGKISAARQNGYKRAADKYKSVKASLYRDIAKVYRDGNRLLSEDEKIFNEAMEEYLAKTNYLLNVQMESACCKDANQNISVEKRDR